MSLVEDFKKFAFKGNAIDLAVGGIIGGAFGKIVSGVVDNVLMPIVSVALPNPDWKTAFFPLKEVVNDKGDKVMAKLTYGALLGALLDFFIIAVILFIIVSAIQKAQERMAKKEAAAPAAPPAQEVLLAEIRDLLKKS
jgi:large conductance mechanosensitive channel